MLGVIGLSSWMSSEGVCKVWRRLVPRCGLWLLLGGSGQGRTAADVVVQGYVGRFSGMPGRFVRCMGLCWVAVAVVGRFRMDDRRWVRVDGGNCGEAWRQSGRLRRGVEGLGEGCGAVESLWIASPPSGSFGNGGGRWKCGRPCVGFSSTWVSSGKSLQAARRWQ